jgi:hypothetical protein
MKEELSLGRKITLGMTYLLALIMLGMAIVNPVLWTVELFKTLITVVIVTGCINMVLGYYFTANEKKNDGN